MIPDPILSLPDPSIFLFKAFLYATLIATVTILVIVVLEYIYDKLGDRI